MSVTLETVETTETTAAELVRNGATFLDEHAPGWRDRIDSDTLSVSLAFSCVLGQLYGSYRDGYDRLNLDIPRAVRLGFYTGSGSYGELTAAWRQELAA